jgi:hypothetical protein
LVLGDHLFLCDLFHQSGNLKARRGWGWKKYNEHPRFLKCLFLSFFHILLVLLVSGQSIDYQSHCGATFGFPCWQALGKDSPQLW